MSRTAASRPGKGAPPCPHAVRRAEEAPRAMARSEAICRASGARLTQTRRKVLDLLLGTHRPLGAYELAEALAPEGRRAAPITVYRALDFLSEQGLAHKLASQNAYVASFHLENGPDITAFLICETCGGVDEVTSQPLTAEIDALLDREGFRPRLRVLEIVGRCPHCQDGREAALDGEGF